MKYVVMKYVVMKCAVDDVYNRNILRWIITNSAVGVAFASSGHDYF
jgi:hypothetical protein